MYYKKKSELKTALSLMANNSDNIQLMNNIYRAFLHVDPKEIVDVELRKLCEIVKTISTDIQNKGLRTPESTKTYIENSSLDEETKKLIASLKDRYTDQIVKEYNYYFSKHRLSPIIDKKIDEVSEAFDKFKKAGIETISEKTTKFIDVFHEAEDLVKELSSAIVDDDVMLIDVANNKTMGMDKLEQTILVNDVNKIKTGNWVDNLTGGGFLNKALYMVFAIAGGFKSGFLQNVAEFVACHTDPKSLLVPSNVTPCVYYLNLEMTSTQMIERRVSFYGGDLNNIIAEVDLDPGSKSITTEIMKLLKENGAKLPVIYEQGNDSYTVYDIKMKLKDIERAGYKVVFLVVDYIDLIKHTSTTQEEYEKKIPIVSKAEQLRALAKEMDIPILTAGQLNREAENLLKQNEHRAAVEDLVARLSSAQLAKAHALKAIPEQIYMCYKQTINDNDYFSIIVDKDRQNKARYVPSGNMKEEEVEKVYTKKKKNIGRVMYVCPMNGFRLSTDVYSHTIRSFENDIYENDNVQEVMVVENINS